MADRTSARERRKGVKKMSIRKVGPIRLTQACCYYPNHCT